MLAALDLSRSYLKGSTAIHHAISTKPAFDTEFAEILYEAGGDVCLTNRFGETGVFEAVKIRAPQVTEQVRKTSAAIQWYLGHDGNLDIKDNDGISARTLLDDRTGRQEATRASRYILYLLRIKASVIVGLLEMQISEDARNMKLEISIDTLDGIFEQLYMKPTT
ncbi:hypothetical protein EUX98_g9008 [Antrodiella citrinella]|uniref:Uncharacterized protein n=1 Tax=Antrodiella citrinella TaxID=2447956 RepID=A0A4S4M027_9APHY|nr:hypothetical protein EUX98_g9008 [Antrodiella citrinella]